MFNNTTREKKETVVLLCVLLVCILITLSLVIALINVVPKPEATQTQPVANQPEGPQYIEIDDIETLRLSDAKSLLDAAQIAYTIVPTDSRIPNRVEKIEFVGEKQENGKLHVEIGTSITIYANEVSKDKIVYLTFDDGPTRDNTFVILNTLNSYGIKATFYLLGENVLLWQDRIQATIEQGHLIGCHSFSHVYHQIYSSPEAFVAEIEQYENALKTVLGDEEYAKIPKLLRFPGGSLGLEPAYFEAVRDKGYKIHDWTAETKDKNGLKTTEDFIENLSLELNIAKNNGRHLIVLMHDMEITKDALPAILDYLISERYYFDTIDNCPEYTIVEN